MDELGIDEFELDDLIGEGQVHQMEAAESGYHAYESYFKRVISFLEKVKQKVFEE
jgi:hypothetical protein